ncbi:hypothetical protein L9Y56_005263 [Klebsiella pneumoniae]|uniref:hypothetical protein n=1 Tax=Klebsiella pneumoniae TaxID=573 RepID=UPI00058C49C3|nr:hypothetical protein [Klebsiella pneumoniae]EKT9178088.1 hypothetical protein [Klebsiella pneumoniae]EKU3950625.1 hypothetical protein [Klebsiella pneumoniae]EKU8650355.1 hypothetical protein [Klebsiella pneumoniae]EKU8659499.1 hypothetical protein [Klebsiella pneumoniae]EKV0887135.1 hypothetical protein [Klebsiella pneumoniae]
MAAGIPKEKSVEYIEMFAEMLSTGATLDDISYRRFLREIEQITSPFSATALGLLYAVAGKFEKSNAAFVEASKEYDDVSIPYNHLVTLRLTWQDHLLKDSSYEYADRYESKRLTSLAFSYAYRFGDRDGLVRYMDRHIRLLSNEEGRELAEKHKEELLLELDDAYCSSGCTQQQFETLALIIGRIAKEFNAELGLVEVSRRGNCCYVADIKNKDPRTIAEMNYALAEAVCDEPLLDDCNLIGRFSPQRELHVGMTYVYQQ